MLLLGKNSNYHKEFKDVRSLVECATYCRAELNCVTAVYQENQRCLLFNAFFSSSIPENVTYSKSNHLINIRPVSMVHGFTWHGKFPEFLVANWTTYS